MHQDEDLQSAIALIKAAKTMVLATCRNNTPWSAPVYYVYVRPDMYFFSSPRSRHIRAALHEKAVAASIHADSDQWEAIQGVQMLGKVSEVQGAGKKINITGRYLAKFPFARDLLTDGAKIQQTLQNRVSLYRFAPLEIHYVDNRQGFGRRLLIEPLGTDTQEA